MLVFASIFSLLASLWILDQETGTWMLVFGQFVLLLHHVMKGQVRAVGAFLFMSFLFFGMRALYIVVEEDYIIFTRLFQLPADVGILNQAVWWATAAILLFHFGSEFARLHHVDYFRLRQQFVQTRVSLPLVSERMALSMVGFQLLSLLVLGFLSTAGRGLYGSPIGAYLYDFPMFLQGGQVFAVVVVLERWLYRKELKLLLMLSVSAVLFLIYTWEMRDLTIFRGFYVTGVMVAGIAVLFRLFPRVSYLWLILPILIGQPLFRTLGETRHLQNIEVEQMSIQEQVLGDRSLREAYWSFYDSRGDLNILDTFAGALAAEPEKRPYLLSWIYVPFHIVPRAIWSGKPEKGVLQDLTFMRGAPFSPGIAGFFLLDGGVLWMLGCMFLLGYLVCLGDGFLLTMPRSYLRCCLLGIFIVNAIFLSRFLLWQWFFQVIYMAVPCVFLSWYLDRRPILAHFGGWRKPLREPDNQDF